jgi:hypothetical protein
VSRPPFNVLNLGAGVQSTTVLLMSLRGELPKLDAAIFADTQWEPEAVYRHLEWLRAECAGRIPIYTVTAGSLRKHAAEGIVRGHKGTARYVSLPLFVVTPDGQRGMIRRQCTKEYKITPVMRFIRETICGLSKGRSPKRGTVAQWFGISADEMGRMRDSRVQWSTHVYPLCGYPSPLLSRRYSRSDCLRWLHQHYPTVAVPRSSCIGCPFHSDSEWAAIAADPAAWADAVEVDEAIRNADGMGGQCFLHRSHRPLREKPFREPQPGLFDEECSGHCFT